jgi:NmrA-like family
VVRDVLVLSFAVDPRVSKTVQGDAQVIQVNYSNDATVKQALAGVDVVISTITTAAVDVQVKTTAAAKEAGVHWQLFVPSEFGLLQLSMVELPLEAVRLFCFYSPSG